MKRIMIILGILTLVICACEKNGPALNKSNPRYVQENEKAVKGTVVEVYTVRDSQNFLDVIAITLRTENGEIPVELGPIFFVMGGPVNLSPGLEIEVKGAQRSHDGQTYIIARELESGDHKLLLREKDGTPLWTGWKRK